MKHLAVTSILILFIAVFLAGCTNTPSNEYKEVLNIGGVELINQGIYQEALEIFNKKIEINVNDTLAWSNKGAVLNGLGRYL